MRDAGMEALVAQDLGPRDALATKAMFGGLAWMWRGHLLCAAQGEGVMARLGKGEDGWALSRPGVRRMQAAGGRPMAGWVQLDRTAALDDRLRGDVLRAACAFVATLPAR
jgi:hypothetical protein